MRVHAGAQEEAQWLQYYLICYPRDGQLDHRRGAVCKCGDDGYVSEVVVAGGGAEGAGSGVEGGEGANGFGGAADIDGLTGAEEQLEIAVAVDGPEAEVIGGVDVVGGTYGEGGQEDRTSLVGESNFLAVGGGD